MKKAIIFAFLVFVLGTNVKAQNGTKFLSLRGGYFLKDAFSGTLSYDWNTKYFRQNEMFVEYFQQFENQKAKSIMGGFVLKPVLTRNGNTIARLRFGAGAGSDTKKFIIAPQVGFEISQSIGKGFDLLFINRNQYVILGDIEKRFRVGAELGLRLPIN